MGETWMEKEYDIVAMGELLIDFTPAGVSETGMCLYERNPGGAPVNMLTAAAKAGLRTAFIGKVGNDMHGKFLIEAVVISLMGGFIGIAFGIGASKVIGMVSGMSTIVSVPTIIMSFAFSMAIGLIFGIYPARKAAKLNPIDALHYE